MIARTQCGMEHMDSPVNGYWFCFPVLVMGVCLGSQCTCVDPASTSDGGPVSGDAATDAGSDRTEASLGDGGAPCVVKPLLGAMRSIPRGTFLIGAPLTEFGRGPFDQDQVQVTLTHAFEIGATELTQAEWVSMCTDNPSDKNGCLDPGCPVTWVTWFDAVAWLNNRICLAALDRAPSAGRLRRSRRPSPN